MNFLPLTEPNPANSLTEVKVSQQINTKKCDQVSSSSINNNNNNSDDDNNNNNKNNYKAISIQAPWDAGGSGSQNF